MKPHAVEPHVVQPHDVPPHWLTRPATIRKLWIALWAVLALTVLAEFVIHRHPHFGADGLPAFNAVYGFVACAAMILLAKAIGLVLKRPDNYYSDDAHE